MASKSKENAAKEVVITTIACGNCPLYLEPERKLDYPNTAPEHNTWVRCGNGSIVKPSSNACFRHPDKRASLVPAATPDNGFAPAVRPLNDAGMDEDADLEGGFDFEAQLKKDIESMAKGKK